jgi:hypothetical protein
MIPIVGGMALSQALGIGWLPFLLLGAGSYFLLTKVLHGNRSRLIPALTVLGVHMGWVLIGCLVDPAAAMASLAFVDVIVLLLLAAWLVAKPGLLPAILILGVQVLSLAANVFALSDTASSNLMFGALIFHIILRIAFITLLVRWLMSRADEQPDALAEVFE